jgi:DMSO reductase anchor subunit
MKGEPSLIAFTLLSQLGVGLHLATLTLYTTLQHPVIVQGYLVALITLGIGLAVSSAHLTRPHRILTAVRGLHHSWMSREALLFALLVALMTFRTIPLWLYGDLTLFPYYDLGLVWLALLAIAAQALIYYKVESRRSWHHPYTLVAFLTTPFILGPLALGLLTAPAGVGGLALIPPLGVGFRLAYYYRFPPPPQAIREGRSARAETYLWLIAGLLSTLGWGIPPLLYPALAFALVAATIERYRFYTVTDSYVDRYLDYVSTRLGR